ncbi:MAG: 30S ribosomal protein S20 [Berkelbacteria bacterium GW2011_GWB1_38_5]|uniref:Small ribosomal subunit protein bS20 n=1 Tax=Berkelbacteria bacterium GW2011_GWB1_38_5 TaxID=1618336 RepID=A0A0G0NA20_9BACT|nr:MAG: 30S ribosomal protein S20 [Berkelbacteria bacterium GW2011_GWB1_38_5]
MPITKSAKKSLKVSKTKAIQNQKQKKELSKAIKQATAANISEVVSKIDKAAKTDIIHKNKAARLKSKLTKKFGTAKNVKAKSENVKTPVKSVKEKTKTPAKTAKKTTTKKAKK